MPSAQVTITQLPAAGAITGTEAVPIVQNGQTVQTTTGAIAASPAQTQTFITLNQEPTLANSRALSGGTGIGLVDGGPLSTLQITLNGAAGTLESLATGFVVKDGGTVVNRTLTTAANGIAITNANGAGGNPQFSLSGIVGTVNSLTGTGIIGITSGTNLTSVTITGTTDEIDVANGTGPGNPTISIATDPVIPGTGAMKLPLGTTGERPGGSNGQIRYNTTTNRYEGYQNGTWSTLGNGDGTVTSVSGTANQISVANGTTTPVVSIANDPVLPGNSSVTVPIGTTGDRAISPVNGMFRYNSQTGTFEGYANNAWGAITTGTGVTSVNVSGGTTGLTTSGGPITSSGTITFAGTLITANGGTGLSSYSAGDMVYYAAGDAFTKLAIGTNAYILTSNGSAPVWTDPASISVSTATNLAGGAAGSIPYQTSPGVTSFLASGTGVLVNNGGNPSYSLTPSGLTSVTVTQNPTAALQLATKQYVDTLVSSGITYHTPVKYEVPNSTGNLNAIYNQPGGPGVGVGATLTNNGTLAAFAPDGPTASIGDRILIYNQTNQFENGVYEVTVVGDGSTPWVLTRTSDADTYALKSINGLGEGDAFFITSGNTGAGETYVCNTSGTITFGTTNITFVQVSATQVYSAGTGLTLTGTTFSLTSPVVTSLGGTGLTSYTAGDLVYYAAGTALSKLGIGTSTYLLTSSGTAPQWSDPSGVTVGSATSATTATNIAGGTANQIPYQTGAGATSFVTAPSVSNTYLEWTGSAFQWSAVTAGVSSVTASAPLASSGGSTPDISLTGTVATGNGGTGLSTYTAGDLVYYSTGTALSKLGIGSSTYLLTSSGTAPQWSDPSAVTVGTATNATNVAVTATSTNATFYPAFVDATTGNQGVEVDSDLTYNPSINTLTAGTVVATTGIFGGTF